MSELENVYNLATALRLAVAKALEENKNIMYARITYARDMKTVQGIAEWALANMSAQQSVHPTAAGGSDSGGNSESGGG